MKEKVNDNAGKIHETSTRVNIVSRSSANFEITIKFVSARLNLYA